MIRVAVRATSPVTQAGLERLVQEDPGINLVSVDGRVLSGDAESQADVIVAEWDGTEESLADLLSAQPAAPPVILLLDDAAEKPVAGVLKAGVKGVLRLNSNAAEIQAAIHAVMEGLIIMDSILAEDLASSAILPPGRPDLVEPLTAREAEVLRLLAEGLGNKEIGACLNISEHTAKFHVASILGKLGATTRTEAVTLGIRYGLIMI